MPPGADRRSSSASTLQSSGALVLVDPAAYHGHAGVQTLGGHRARRAWKSVTVVLEELREVDGCVVASGRIAALRLPRRAGRRQRAHLCGGVPRRARRAGVLVLLGRRRAGVGQRAPRTALASASASPRVETSPAKRASSTCASTPPDLRAGLDPELSRELVAAHQRRRRPVGAPRRAPPRASPAPARGGLRSRRRPCARGRQAVGDPSTVTSTSTGSQARGSRARARRRAGSWTRKPSRRWWRASAGDVRSQALGGPQRLRRRAPSGAPRSWPRKVTRPSAPDVAGPRLGDVVQQRAEAQRPPRVSSSASGSASTARDRAAAAPARRRGRARARRVRASTASVWSYTSRWWKALCWTPRRAASSGSTASSARPRPAARSPAALRRRDICRSSAKTRSGATPPARRGARAPPRVGLGVEAELAGEPHDASVRSGSSAKPVGADHPQAPRVEVGRPAVRIDQLAAAQRLGHRVDRQSRRRGRPRAPPPAAARCRPARLRSGRPRARRRTSRRAELAPPRAAARRAPPGGRRRRRRRRRRASGDRAAGRAAPPPRATRGPPASASRGTRSQRPPSR